jgi:hypothetical protein
MKSSLTAALIALGAVATATAQDVPTSEAAAPLVTPADDLAQFVWVARPVVVFADSPNDPRFIQQMDLLEAGQKDLIERDVVVLTDTDPAANGPLRTQLRPRGFSLVLLGKDGKVALRKPEPWHVRELTRAIDKMPLREEEMRERRRGEG